MYGKMNIDMLRQILELPNGIPSHDTINRVFSLRVNASCFGKLRIKTYLYGNLFQD
jgi:hypothetical protein